MVRTILFPSLRSSARAAIRTIRPVICACIAGALLVAWPGSRAAAQEDDDLPILPTVISDQPIEMQGRYARQWTDEDGTLVLAYTGAFKLSFGQRTLSSNNAIVWISPQKDEAGRKFYELTVYLSELAEVVEPAGTVTEDQVLLVRNLRTYGKIFKRHDAHAPEDMSQTPLYQLALRDRRALEARAAATQPTTPAINRPNERRIKTERPLKTIYFKLPPIEPAETASKEKVFVAIGGVYFSQEGDSNGPPVEIRADNAVIFPGERGAAALFQDGPTKQTPTSVPTTQPRRRRGQAPPSTEEAEQTSKAGGFGFNASAAGDQIRAVYLEGDVILTAGNRAIHASRLYYDFERSQALVLDAVFRAELPDRNVPLYMRAAEIRQLNAREFTARNALVSTSEFATPSYHIGADRVVLRDTTRRDSAGRAVAEVTGTYELTQSTLNIYGMPILWWPRVTGSINESETALQSFSSGYSDDFGAEIRTRWNLFSLLGIDKPREWTANVRLDYLSERGPGTGVDANYATQREFGLFRSYYINDNGEDDLGPLRRDEEDPDTVNRGRVLWRHRQFLADDWIGQVEISYISDPNFLEVYERSEWFEGKEQETLLYLKRVRDVEAISILANWRILDFVTQTEHLPEITYRRMGDTFLDPVVLYHESRIGAVRYNTDDRTFFDDNRYDNLSQTQVTARADGRQEAELPIKLGALSVVPFSTVRGTYWGDSDVRGGTLWRGMGLYGVRGSTAAYRVFDDVRSELFDIHGIRHIIKPEFVTWWSHSNTRSELITPFDYGVETIDDFYGVGFAVRQTWQTKRGAGENRRSVDLLTIDIETGFFGKTDGRNDISNGYANPLRPENSRTRDHIAGHTIYRLSDTTSLLYDVNYDFEDGNFDQNDVSLAVERDPRLAYVLGTRYAGDIHMSLVGGGFNYKLTQKHIMAARAYWDVDSGEIGEVGLAYIRKLPRWYVSLNIEFDEINDDFSVSLSIWPEGVPEWTLGSRRFTGVSTSTGIRP